MNLCQSITVSMDSSGSMIDLPRNENILPETPQQPEVIIELTWDNRITFLKTNRNNLTQVTQISQNQALNILSKGKALGRIDIIETDQYASDPNQSYLSSLFQFTSHYRPQQNGEE